MSGICGILNLDGLDASLADVSSMASLLRRRGPDRTGMCTDRAAGLGHTLLTTTPELVFERQPYTHAASGCVITADVRLDNREELFEALHVSTLAAPLGDAELVLEAYLAWGEDCAARLLGDFAFAVWDPRRRAMFCARDQFGMRPLYYHHTPERLFAFASEPRAILVLPQVPHQINEGRVADCLVPGLEWLDNTSTFFTHVFRLPPAHAITVTRERLLVHRYWVLEPGPELRLPSDEAYAEALLEVLTAAVRSRLRGSGPVGSMLSGGLDSGSIVAISSRLLPAERRLPTFSGVGPDPGTCLETRNVHAALTMAGLEPHLVDYTRLGSLMPELEALSWDLGEPFDYSTVLLRAMYLTAQRLGVRVVLDGAASDVVWNEGTYIIRLFRQGRVAQAWREAWGREQFFGRRPMAGALRSVRAAATPDAVRRLRRRLVAQRRGTPPLPDSIISLDFARRVSLIERLEMLDDSYGSAWKVDYQQERAASIHPHVTAGRERYNRVASAVGVEPRDPFLDRRVVSFGMTLPGGQRLDGGWPKVVLRRAMAGRLPDAVRWGRGKPHLGWLFATSLMKSKAARLREDSKAIIGILEPYVDPTSLQSAWVGYFDRDDPAQADRVLAASALAEWLQGATRRPLRGSPDSC